jgi:hypothetical protein
MIYFFILFILSALSCQAQVEVDPPLRADSLVEYTGARVAVEADTIVILNSDAHIIYVEDSLSAPLHTGVIAGLITLTRAKQILADLGYAVGPIDEVNRPEFIVALNEYLQNIGVKVDGEIGPVVAKILLETGRGIEIHRARK